MNISIQLVHQYMTIFFNLSPTSNHLHPLQVENCDSNSRLVVGGDDNGKFRLERVEAVECLHYPPRSSLPTAIHNFQVSKKYLHLYYLNKNICQFNDFNAHFLLQIVLFEGEVKMLKTAIVAIS